MSESKRAALYVRVSTDHQTVENQIRELTAIAERRGWSIVATFSDEGISGSKGRAERPGLDAMLKGAGRGQFDVVMVWAIDRLGRSTIDLLNSVHVLENCRVDLFIDQQSLDTTSAVGKLVFTIFGALAEFERHMIRQRVSVGIARAKAKGVRFGRPRIDAKTESKIKAALALGDKGMLKIAAELGVGSGTVQRVAATMRAGS